MTGLTFPNEVVAQFFHVANLKFCEVLALTNRQNYSVCQTYVTAHFQKAISNDRVIHTLCDYEKATLFFKLKIIRSVNLATQSPPSDFDFKCLIMSKQLNWGSVTAKAKALKIEMGSSKCALDEMGAVWEEFIKKDYAVLLSENAVSSKESKAADKSAEELCEEFSVELPTAFELFAYHVFKIAQFSDEFQELHQRFLAEIEPVKEKSIVDSIQERYTPPLKALQEKYFDKSDSIWVPTSTPISGQDLRMKVLFSSDEEKGNFSVFHEEKNIKVKCIRGRVQLYTETT